MGRASRGPFRAVGGPCSRGGSTGGSLQTAAPRPRGGTPVGAPDVSDGFRDSGIVCPVRATRCHLPGARVGAQMSVTGRDGARRGSPAPPGPPEEKTECSPI